MKKLFVLLLGVVLVLGLTVVAVACSDTEETTTTEEATTTTEAAAWTSAQAWEHIGETGSITGVVVKVVVLGEAKTIMQLDSDQDDPGLGSHAMVEPQDYDKFGGVEALQALVGKTITITGELYPNPFSKNKPEIQLTEASQLVIAE